MRERLRSVIDVRSPISKYVKDNSNYKLSFENSEFSIIEQSEDLPAKQQKFANDSGVAKEFVELSGANDLTSFREFLIHHSQLLSNNVFGKCFMTSDEATLNLARNILGYTEFASEMLQQKYSWA